MQITDESSSQIIIKDYGIFSTITITGILFIIVGLFILLAPDTLKQVPSWIGIIGIIIGAFVISKSERTTLTLDKNSNKLLITKKSLINKKQQERSLNGIKSIEIDSTHRYSNNRSKYFYNLVLVFADNNNVSLSSPGSSIDLLGQKQLVKTREVGQKTAKFLGVPFEERKLPTTNEILSAIKSGVSDSIENEIEKQAE